MLNFLEMYESFGKSLMNYHFHVYASLFNACVQ